MANKGMLHYLYSAEVESQAINLQNHNLQKELKEDHHGEFMKLPTLWDVANNK